MQTLTKWNDFVARRRLDVKKWMDSNNIKNYPNLVDHCQAKGIAPPTLTQVKEHFPAPPSKKSQITAKDIVEIQPMTRPLDEVVEILPNTLNLTSELEEKEELPKKRRRRKKKSTNSESE